MVNVRRLALSSLVLVAVLTVFGPTATAMERPNALDLRVDTLTTRALLTEPATLLVDPARQAGALRRAHWTVVGLLLTSLFEAAALFYFWSSGSAASLRDWLRRRIRREWWVRFCFGAVLALIARLAAFLPAFYLYRVDRTLSLTFELTRWWALLWAFHTIVAMIVAGLIAAIVLWLAERTHQWYVYTILGVLAASVAWAYASPMPILRFPGSMPAEIQYALAFQMGHIAHGDRASIALIEGGVIIVFAALAVVIADRIRFRRDDDPLSRLAIVGALLALVYLAAVPVRNSTLSSYDFSADAYAVARTRDPAAAVRALVRNGDQRMIEVCPEWSATAFLYTSPGIGARIAAINHVPSNCR
ncbi:MAG: M48 family metalloprotease [Candidatus Eremiobacteraeota bacterium]|nr:M48 family metalloprotease [Candidatus Eremiobacteraeota bacterium]